MCKREFVGTMVVCTHDGTLLMQVKHDQVLGSVLQDKYLVLSEIGRGGMSIVYKARDDAMRREVAVKMLQAGLMNDQTSIKRFQQEAQAASCVQHQNVVSIFDFGVSPTGQPYLVMELLPGGSLADLIKSDNHIQSKRAAGIFIQACDALEHAHQKGVLHRDLKSSNIMLVNHESSSDFVKVVDFGIAKLMPNSGKQQQNLTQTGEIFGSPIYMSPEQCLGMPLDARSDVYSMGTMLYEALTGQPPLLGANIIDTMQMHVETVPASPSKVRGDLQIPKPIEMICLRALEKKAENRFRSMGEFRDALKTVFPMLPDTGLAKPRPTGTHQKLPQAGGQGITNAPLYATGGAGQRPTGNWDQAPPPQPGMSQGVPGAGPGGQFAGPNPAQMQGQPMGMAPGRQTQGGGQPGMMQPGMQPGQPGMPQGQHGQPGMMPGQPGMMPGQPGMMPGQPGMMPGQPGMMPGQPGMMPGQPGMMPGQPGMMPGQPGMMPGQPGMMPGQPGMMPGQPGMMPGQPGRQAPGPMMPVTPDGMAPTGQHPGAQTGAPNQFQQSNTGPAPQLAAGPYGQQAPHFGQPSQFGTGAHNQAQMPMPQPQNLTGGHNQFPPQGAPGGQMSPLGAQAITGSQAEHTPFQQASSGPQHLLARTGEYIAPQSQHATGARPLPPNLEPDLSKDDSLFGNPELYGDPEGEIDRGTARGRQQERLAAAAANPRPVPDHLPSKRINSDYSDLMTEQAAKKAAKNKNKSQIHAPAVPANKVPLIIMIVLGTGAVILVIVALCMMLLPKVMPH
ncbi:MAG TPA: protein kinase [Oculatellaceae cyanobacterium]